MKQKNHQQSKLRLKIHLVEDSYLKLVEFPKLKNIIIQLTQLQKKYDNLENRFEDLGKENKALHVKKNNKIFETITCLQTKIESFEKEKEKTSVAKQTQTERGIVLKGPFRGQKKLIYHRYGPPEEGKWCEKFCVSLFQLQISFGS